MCSPPSNIGLILGRTLRDSADARAKLTQRQADVGRVTSIDARAPGVECQQRTYDGKRASGPVDSHRAGGVGSVDEGRDRQQEKGHGEAAQDAENGKVSPKCAEEEYQGQEAPHDEEYAQGDGVRPVIAAVRRPDAEGWDQEHGVGEPEGAVGAVEGCAKGVADAELHDASDELGSAAEEDREAEDCLVGADAAKGVGAGKAKVGGKCVSALNVLP